MSNDRLLFCTLSNCSVIPAYACYTVAQEASIGGQVIDEATKETVLQRYVLTAH